MEESVAGSTCLGGQPRRSRLPRPGSETQIAQWKRIRLEPGAPSDTPRVSSFSSPYHSGVANPEEGEDTNCGVFAPAWVAASLPALPDALEVHYNLRNIWGLGAEGLYVFSVDMVHARAAIRPLEQGSVLDLYRDDELLLALRPIALRRSLPDIVAGIGSAHGRVIELLQYVAGGQFVPCQSCGKSISVVEAFDVQLQEVSITQEVVDPHSVLCQECGDRLEPFWRQRAQYGVNARVERLRDPIPAQLRFRVLQRDGFRCAYCGRTSQQGAELHVDHVVPFAHGGETGEDNLITSCAECNLGKSATEVI